MNETYSAHALGGMEGRIKCHGISESEEQTIHTCLDISGRMSSLLRFYLLCVAVSLVSGARIETKKKKPKKTTTTTTTTPSSAGVPGITPPGATKKISSSGLPKPGENLKVNS